ncbi:DNA helicase IV [Streptoalloteichus tenebrarius]|uniref:DNA helicase IV n=1 Tax=Streptoalloteichus tenebrarius (strain ATCC 17920 / DSM 40477 / JCM 4838 / CBS 697.72 / NBRC 16177 / NCIMB 11028 / NRRL B-12390 / A12253. 1 / ISP 5477) TaxID=1933 RepID=A0ABT1HSQ2_STRSD|nr:ATP-binding domain-containing protein [Streptoalloteichus tenebrarius]MCP2258553.1 DNA helicase IV [Streptoalloteichus tenebrarius]BFF04080.1 AAA family ATPase [Streptoalloteichus tenebrarius]
MLYGRLDGQRAETRERLARVLREHGEDPSAVAERNAASTHYADQLSRLDAAENGLCFGRLDLADGERRYVGRLGMFDEGAEYEPLLVDWRAPAARPFYVATAAAPEGVRRRRHIRTSGRTVVGVDDELLDLAGQDGAGGDGLVGEATLLAALNADRTGHMRDIVETIQAEQDRVIRSEHQGVLVVQGGPGTGKTAVALHRAAYLLYTQRERLARRGVLIIGPNTGFLRYVSQVLPSLGETGVLLSTIGELFPGIVARRTESAEAAEIKGRLSMVEMVAAAVRDRQRVPDEPLEIDFDGQVLHLDPETCARARDRARRTGLLHNQARPVFVAEIVDALTHQAVELIGADVYGGGNLLDAEDRAEIRRELLEDQGVRAVLSELWPVLTPRRLLGDLFASADLLSSAAPWLSDDERALLLRERAGGWTPADVPLLDEAAELLGVDDRMARLRAERERRERLAYAQGVLDVLAGSASQDLEDEDDPEVITAADLVDATAFAERHEHRSDLTVAERAAADRTWTFGHVIVDEAQELSEMAWRLLMRRCPSRSMTLVGDVAQTGDLAGTSSWGRVLDPYVGDRWRLERLSVNYRTPAEIMSVASAVLAGMEPPLDPPASARSSGFAPWRCATRPAELAGRLAEITAREVAEVGAGRVAVIVPAGLLEEVGAAVVAAVPEASVGPDPDLERPVVVLPVARAKGLEFDSVLVVEPALMLAESSRGRNDLYVALTRATRRLGVVHADGLPEELAGLRERGGRLQCPERREGRGRRNRDLN